MKTTTTSGVTGKSLFTPRPRLAWAIIVTLLLGAIVNYLDRSNLAIANPLIAAQFHLEPAVMGGLLSLFLWPYAIANLLAGWLVDRYGPKRLFSLAVGFWSAVTIATAFATNYIVFGALRVLLGITESPFFTSGVKVADRWFPKSQKALATSTFNTGPQIASAIAPPALTLLMLSLGWQGMFIITGILGFLVLVVWLFVYRDPRPGEVPQEAHEAEQVISSEEEELSAFSWKDLFRYRSTWGMILGNFGVVYTYWVYLTWLPGYLETSRHLTILKTGFVASIPYLVGIIGVPLGGRVSDWLLKRGVTPINARRIPIIAGTLIVAVSVVPAVYVSNIALSVTLLAIGFFGSSIPSGVVWTLATDVAPRRYVASLGAIQNAGGFIGGALAPIVTGIVVQATGTFNLAFVIGAILAVISALCYYFILKDPIRPYVAPSGAILGDAAH